MGCSCGGLKGFRVRRSGGVEQDVSVLEILCFRTVLQVLLQAVPALVAADGRDGRLVDDDLFGGFNSGHDAMWRSKRASSRFSVVVTTVAAGLCCAVAV